MSEKLQQIQQGDVLFQEVTGIPEGARQMPHKGPIVVARGEQSVHNHVIKSDQASLWTLTRNGVNELYLEVKSPVTIIHDEHKPLPIPTGIYRVGRVKEYDYFADMKEPVRERQVLD